MQQNESPHKPCFRKALFHRCKSLSLCCIWHSQKLSCILLFNSKSSTYGLLFQTSVLLDYSSGNRSVHSKFQQHSYLEFKDCYELKIFPVHPRATIDTENLFEREQRTSYNLTEFHILCSASIDLQAYCCVNPCESLEVSSIHTIILSKQLHISHTSLVNVIRAAPQSNLIFL